MIPTYDEIVDECPCEGQGNCRRCHGTGVIITQVPIIITEDQPTGGTISTRRVVEDRVEPCKT